MVKNTQKQKVIKTGISYTPVNSKKLEAIADTNFETNKSKAAKLCSDKIFLE